MENIGPKKIKVKLNFNVALAKYNFFSLFLEAYVQESRLEWNHTRICNRKNPSPSLPLSLEAIKKLTWRDAKYCKNMVNYFLFILFYSNLCHRSYFRLKLPKKNSFAERNKLEFQMDVNSFLLLLIMNFQHLLLGTASLLIFRRKKKILFYGECGEPAKKKKRVRDVDYLFTIYVLLKFFFCFIYIFGFV